MHGSSFNRMKATAQEQDRTSQPKVSHRCRQLCPVLCIAAMSRKPHHMHQQEGWALASSACHACCDWHSRQSRLTLAQMSLPGGILCQALEGRLCRCGQGKALPGSWQHMSLSGHNPASHKYILYCSTANYSCLSFMYFDWGCGFLHIAANSPNVGSPHCCMHQRPRHDCSEIHTC